MKHVLPVLLLTLLFCAQSSASNFSQGAAGAYTAHKRVVAEFLQEQFIAETQKALDALVHQGVESLKEKGFTSDATLYLNEWSALYSTSLYDYTQFELGDHAPINKWLSKFYKTLKEKLGDGFVRFIHLDDLNVINHALPVVMSPRLNRATGKGFSELEYQKHFVALAAAVTYWATYIGCFVGSAQLLPMRRFCSVAADALRHLMKNILAPRISKRVYARANGIRRVQEILNYDSSEELKVIQRLQNEFEFSLQER